MRKNTFLLTLAILAILFTAACSKQPQAETSPTASAEVETSTPTQTQVITVTNFVTITEVITVKVSPPTNSLEETVPRAPQTSLEETVPPPPESNLGETITSTQVNPESETEVIEEPKPDPNAGNLELLNNCPEGTTWSAYQAMKGGLLVWLENGNCVFVLESATGIWYDTGDRWDGHAHCIINTPSPAGTPPMISGFSWLWCEHLDGPNGQLGWPTEAEHGENTVVERNDDGSLTIKSPAGIFNLKVDGTVDQG